MRPATAATTARRDAPTTSVSGLASRAQGHVAPPRPAASATSSTRTASAASSAAAASSTARGSAPTPAATAASSGVVSRASRLAALRAQRDTLRAEVSQKSASVSELEGEIQDLRVSLASESDALAAVHQAHQLDSAKSALLHAFLAECADTRTVWQEYLERIRRTALLVSQHGTNATTTQFFSHDAAGDGATQSAAQRALKAALLAVEDSFQHTLNTGEQAADEAEPSQPLPYMKLTVDAVASRPELRTLFGLDDHAAVGTRFHPATFLGDLNAEVERGTLDIQRRMRELETERTQDSEGVAPESSPAQAAASIQETFSTLITALQTESTTRFVQAQKLANETDALAVILEELQQKQREGDAAILDAPSTSVPFDTKQTLQSVRRLQNMQLHLAALKSQMQFCVKTYGTFAHIRDSRQTAMDAFASQKHAIDSFQSQRKANERRLVEMVLQNKELRKKATEYEGRIMSLVMADVQPLCTQLASTAQQLVGSVSREVAQGLACIVSPLSTLEAGRESGGPGRVPIARLALHQIQHPSTQSNQLHALIMDPFGSNGAVAANASFKGLLGFPLYKSPTHVLLYMQELVHKALHLSLVQRTSSTAYSELLGSAAADPQLDLCSLADWSSLQERVREFHARREGEWTTALRGVLTQATETLDVALPHLQTLLNSYWTQPAQACIPHLRNRLGYNIDDYTAQMRTLVVAIRQQEQRYNRALRHKIAQPL